MVKLRLLPARSKDNTCHGKPVANWTGPPAALRGAKPSHSVSDPRNIGIAFAGAVTGLGIVAMHYLGMSAIGGKTVTYETAGYFISSGIAIGSSVCALWLAYKRRALSQIAIGSFVLGITISAMHYTACCPT